MIAAEDLGTLLDIPGFRLGHAGNREGKTGVTVVLAEDGAAGAAEARGSATGTRQFDSLVSAHHPAPGVHALVFAGGSAYGLSAADGVVEELARRRIGLGGRHGVIPLVPTAILFDLAFGDPRARPDAGLALRALEAADTGAVDVGSVGVGTGATVGKIRGVEHATKGGFGFSALRGESGFTVAAAVGVNAFGDVRDPESGTLLAGVRRSPESPELADSRRLLAGLSPEVTHPWESPAPEGNTTLAAVLTDADLSKTLLLKVCQMAFGGLYRTLAPALTLYDGDLVATLASRRVPAHPHAVGVLAEEAVSRAIVRAIRSADGFGIVPAHRDLHPGG
ncbi:MAG: P1 family peptidase [Thermoanaerobaculia bacterium]|nr:P1 family peptidase [Thermoanaerobaculia bacterium]